MSRSLHTDPYELRAARRAGRPPVRTTRPRPGFLHPAGAADIAGLLAFFGPTAVYGLHRIELRQRAAAVRPGLLIAGLKSPGVIVLFEQPRPPWLLAGRFSAAALARLRRAGARLRVTAAHTAVDWPGETLRDFMFFDGLMHEVGHHMLQHVARKRVVPVMRAADHERRADAFATACRRAWTAASW